MIWPRIPRQTLERFACPQGAFRTTFPFLPICPLSALLPAPMPLLAVGIVWAQSLDFWHPCQGFCQKCNFYCSLRIAGIH